MENEYNLAYQSQTRLGQMFGIFTFLALFIACMGMFGLVAHHMVQRTKEICIRKVLGATVSSILALVSKDFLILVSLSAIIAFPIAWWTMDRWLQDFAYKITIEWWMFTISGLVALGVALSTIFLQTIRAGLANPVKGLRSE